MNKDELQKDIEKAIVETFNDLRTLYKRTGVPTTRLVFPKYNKTDREDKNKNNKDEWRISEQEFRFVFIEKISEILEDNDLYYSIETPTESKYKFSKEGEKGKKPEISKQGKSAAFDLTIKDCGGNNVALIEFKAHSASPHEIAKDLCKLFNDKEGDNLRYFINVFKTISSKTEKSFRKKLSSKNSCWPIENDNFTKEVHVIAEALDSKRRIEDYISYNPNVDKKE